MHRKILALLLLCGAPPPQDPLPPLAMGGQVQGELDVSATFLLELPLHGELRGKAFALETGGPGPCHVELRALDFDPLLVVLDPAGRTVVQDDDGGAGLNAIASFEALDGVDYRAVCFASVPGSSGSFEIALERGSPESLSPSERSARNVEDFERRIPHLEARLGPSYELAHVLTRYTHELRGVGRGEEALELCRRAAEMTEAAMGPDAKETAAVLAELARAHSDLGNHRKAFEILSRVMGISNRTLGPDHPVTATYAFYAAQEMGYTDERGRAAELAERALRVLRATEGAEQTSIGCLAFLASLYVSDGDYELAELRIRAAIETTRTKFDADPSIMGRLLKVKGRLQSSTGDRIAARETLEEALSLCEGQWGWDYPETANVAYELATVQFNLGDRDSAAELLERAIETWSSTLGPENLGVVRGLYMLGRISVRNGHLTTGRDYYERAIAMNGQLDSPGSDMGLRLRESLGAVLAHVGDLEAAEENLRVTVQESRRLFGPGHVNESKWLWSHGWVLARMGRLEEAVERLEHALALAEIHDGPGHRKVALRRTLLAKTLVVAGRAARAYEVQREGQAERWAAVAYTLSGLTDGERHQFLSLITNELRVLAVAAAALDSAEVHEEVYADVLRWKGWASRLLLAGREQQAGSSSPETRALSEQLEDVRARLTTLALNEDASRDEGHDQRLADLREERKRLELALSRSSEPIRVEPASPEQVRTGLQEGSALVDFMVFENLYAWVSRPDRDGVEFRDLGPAAAVEQAVHAHLRVVRQRISDEGAANDELRKALWEPLADAVGDAELVIVSPDGFLGALPLETILLEEGQYLVEERGFVYTQDTTWLLELLGSDPASEYRSLLAVGGLDFDGLPEPSPEPAEGLAMGTPRNSRSALRGSFTSRWEPLPATFGEVEAVIALYAESFGTGHSLALSGPEATEQRLERELPRHGVLHLATHGFFQPQGLPSMWVQAVEDVQSEEAAMRNEPRRLVGLHPGLLSGLVCSGANLAGNGVEDGYLTAEELQWLDLSGVDLVVLSACETALGETRAGEGMVGLRRACHLAGADAVISSLWTVSDDSTSTLMNRFYGNLWRGNMGRLEALRAAQHSMIARRLPPVAWGAFVLSGDWR